MLNKLNPDSTLGLALQKNKIVQILEVVLVFIAAFIFIKIEQSFVNENPIFRHIVVWFANVIMLVIVFLGLKLRGQSWKHLGLSLKNINLKSILLSLLVFIAAVFGFILGAILMANIVGIPESADLNGYNFLQGNLPLLIGTLVAVFIVSSFGEEVIYRGFLITRISEIGGSGKNWLKVSVFISSLIFGLIHFEWGLMGIVQTGFMGLALGVSFILLKRNLWVLVFAHGYMDAILLIQMYFGVKM